MGNPLFVEFDDNDERWIMFQKLHWAFIAEYTNESLPEILRKFEKWAASKTQEELNIIFGDEKEMLYTKENILRSMFENEE